MKDKVRGAESCCKQISEHIVLFCFNTSLTFCVSKFLFLTLTLKATNEIL